jgi:release factor glutamine methyltransferase
MLTIDQWLRTAAARLEEVGIESSKLDAELMLAESLGISRAQILGRTGAQLTAKEASQAERLLSLRLKHIPLAQIVGRREFYGLELKITPDVLIPRVETEKMVELAIKYIPKGVSVIDMGTGSGALAIALAKYRPDLSLTASDVSAEALEVAKVNARSHRVNIRFIQSSLWQDIEDSFKAILTNLPYLSEDAMSQLMADAKHEPSVALEGGGDGLNLYREFLRGIPEHLEASGLLFTECDPWQQNDLIAEAARYGMRVFEEDYFILGLKRSPVRLV